MKREARSVISDSESGTSRVYYDTEKPAMVSDRLEVIGPDGFLSLGVPRVRPSNELRLSYVGRQEQVIPQWVLEVVSR
jgi:hypothetical protein